MEPKISDFELLEIKDCDKPKAYTFNKLVTAEYMKLVPSKENIDKYTDLDTTTRFLMAKNFNEKKALEMWTNWRKWRLEYRVDDITEKDVENELKQGKAFFHGFDKMGRPCIVVKIKRHRPGEISVEETVRFGVYMMEKGIKLCKERKSDKIVIIYDREGFNSKNFDSKLATVMKSLMKILQGFYAERLAKMYVLHPNWFYKMMFAMVKPFLEEKTRKKIVLLSNVEDLKKDFDSSQLLIEHGGTSPYQYCWPPGSKPIVDDPTINDNENGGDEETEDVPDETELKKIAAMNGFEEKDDQ